MVRMQIVQARYNRKNLHITIINLPSHNNRLVRIASVVSVLITFPQSFYDSWRLGKAPLRKSRLRGFPFAFAIF